MPGPSPGCHYHDIETQHPFGKGRIVPDTEFGRPLDAKLRLRRRRLKPRDQLIPALDLDEGDEVAATAIRSISPTLVR